SGEFQQIYQKWFGLDEDRAIEFSEIIRYAAYILIPLSLVLLSTLLWSWSLRRQIAAKTDQLARSEAKYRLLADNTIDTIYTATPDLEFTYVNPACTILTGYTPEELIGTRLVDYLAPDKLAELVTIIEREIAKGPDSNGVIFETEFIGKHGGLVQIEVHGRALFDAQDRVVKLQGTARDVSDRKKAEYELRRSEALLNISQRIGKIGGWEWDLSRNEVHATEEMFRLHEIDPGGIPPQARERLDRSIACHEEGARGEIRAAVRQCRDEGTPYEMECRFTTAKGRRLWIRSAGEAVFQDGRVTKIYGTVQDITADKDTEEHLRRQNQFTQTILDNLPIGLAVNSMDEGRASYMNKPFEDIYGWPAEKLTDIETFFVRVYPDPEYRKSIIDRVSRDIASGDPARMSWDDIEVTGQDGSKRTVHAKNIPIYDQNVMISTVQDVTQRKSAQEALKESVEQFRLLVETSPEAIIVETRWHFAYLNQAAARLFGAGSAGQLLGQPLLQRIAPARRVEFSRRIEQVENSGEPLSQGEEICLKMNSEQVPVEVSAVPIRYRGQAGSLLFMTDVTERQEREKANRELQEQLNQAQKMESMGRLAGGVAHDYNNMLGVIIGYSELTLQKMDQDNPLRADIEEILTAARRSTDITRQLLAFASQQTVAPKVLNLNETIESMLKMLRRLIGEDIELRWQPGNPLWPVRMDASQVDQVLANLCINARDAIDQGGILTIETRNIHVAESYTARQADARPGAYVMLTVGDNGRGMDPAVKDRIFEPFFTTKGPGKGTGLGLATAYG
ncbi:MAG TPA: PAS domain S-box protein, partial [Desulfuromonadales bacterium]|nr:PAS domain S-box protein [Desulfuromonadales bacterium]